MKLPGPEYASSPALKVRQNKDRKYVPLDLLRIWGFRSQSRMVASASDSRQASLEAPSRLNEQWKIINQQHASNFEIIPQLGDQILRGALAATCFQLQPTDRTGLTKSSAAPGTLDRDRWREILPC